ncbi:hypothetical protein L917_15276 [Phytophthora nicotianae]|uniref:Uncharacterized protein n=1 Tax=Phytophthora nicotianae TaxID=4792 RepID=W2KIK4_PHYNI|nr:hypothetical protein L917_15276 [Phytophthora nicotianae]
MNAYPRPSSEFTFPFAFACPQQCTLNTRGHLVLYRAVPDDITNDSKTLWIHITWNNVEFDDNRFQAFVPDSTARALTVDLERHYRTFFDEGSASEWHFLKTVTGADDQLVRREFAPRISGEESMDVTSVLGSMYLAVEDNTFFYAFGWNNHIVMLSNRHLIRLKQGDIVLFRGDCMYARVGYPGNNVCVHGFIDTPSTNLPISCQ